MALSDDGMVLLVGGPEQSNTAKGHARLHGAERITLGLGGRRPHGRLYERLHGVGGGDERRRPNGVIVYEGSCHALAHNHTVRTHNHFTDRNILYGFFTCDRGVYRV